MTTYSQFAASPKSEKIVLATIEASSHLKLFTLHSGSVYVRDMDYFVSSVKQGDTILGQGTNSSLLAGKFWFDALSKKLYLRMSDSSNPKTKQVYATFRFFFSNAPYNLPYDLLTGTTVEFEPRISSIGSLGQTLDDQNTGIVLESSSSIELENSDRYFDEIFDTLIWENKDIKFYSWSPSLPMTEAKKIFEGVIESKDFSPFRVSFKVKDFVFKLKNKVNLSVFSDVDGVVQDSIIGTPKRRIYGKAKQVKTIPIDCIKDGFNLTGTVTILSGFSTITGTGTLFLSELSPNDELVFVINNEKVKFTVDSIISNTSGTIAKNAESNINGLPAIVRPSRPYRFKNRRWHLAGHKIRASSASIISSVSSRQFQVDTNSDFYPDDIVTVNATTTAVTRITGNQIILEQAIFPVPLLGDIISKEPITAVFFGEKEILLNRDFTLTNTTEAILEIDPLAEFNIAKERLSSVTLTFTNGSRTVTTSSTIDLRTIIQSRDWIRKLTQSSNAWVEVLDVTEQSIILRTPFTFTTGTEKGIIKNIDLIEDESLITVDCYGFDDNKWVKTASDCVKHLLVNDANITSINETSFSQANSDCDYLISMVIPSSVGGVPPQIRDVISDINESVLGSLYGNSSQEVCYSIVNTRRPETLLTIKDDDVLSWEVQTSQKIINQVKINYRPFVDKITGEGSFLFSEFENDFVNKNVGIKNSIEKTCYLYEELAAINISQRVAFYNSLSQSVLTLKAKANFFTSAVNDRVYVEFDRIYKRYGGSIKRKIGVISGIKKSMTESEVVMNDLGNIFNRCPTIAPITSLAFTTASDDEKLKYGYILDNETKTPDITSEEGLGSHLIG